jgi:hypothetical protein
LFFIIKSLTIIFKKKLGKECWNLWPRGKTKRSIFTQQPYFEILNN